MAHRAKRYRKTHDVLDRADLHRLQRASVDAARERTEEGHRQAGRETNRLRRHSGPVVRIDDALRDPEPTDDQRLLDSPHGPPDFRRNDAWRVLRITGEVIEGIDSLGDITRAVFPVVLFGKDYWGGLYDWLRDTMLAAGNIAGPDLELVQLTDTPEEAAAAVIAAKHGT